MRFLRGLLAAATVLAAGCIAIGAGHIGSAGWWRGFVALAIGGVAWVILAFGSRRYSLAAGDHTRVHADPGGRHRPSLEPCAYTSHRWTVALRVVQGLWILVALGAFVGAIFFADW